MRIVGGRFRGRRLESPADRAIRPTSDRVRQALFDHLAHGPYDATEGAMPRGARVLDAFCGTGALGLEALSRGARSLTLIDRSAEAIALARRNARGFGGEDDEILILRRDATRPGRAPGPHDLALLDPPYGEGLAATALAALATDGWLAPEALVVVETGAKEAWTPPDGFAVRDERRYGAARLTILQRGATRA